MELLLIMGKVDKWSASRDIPEDIRKKYVDGGGAELLPYANKSRLKFDIKRDPKDKYRGQDLTMFANALKFAIDHTNDVYVLDFVPSYEKGADEDVVEMKGDHVIIPTFRASMNDMLVSQQPSAQFELHIVNETREQQPILSGCILLKGSSSKKWHGLFSPTNCIGVIEPMSELHISNIFMKRGRSFTTEIPRYVGGCLIMPPDHIRHTFNGLVGSKQMDMKVEDAMVIASQHIAMEIKWQPYINPVAILIGSIDNMKKSVEALMTHVKLARPHKKYEVDGVVITCEPGKFVMVTHMFGVELLNALIGSMFNVAGARLTHATARLAHKAKKTVVLRLAVPSATNVVDAALELLLMRVNSIAAAVAV
jgi:hypothetical protein